MKIWDEVLKSWLGKFWDKDLKSVSRNMWDEDLKKEISWKESRHKAQRPKKKNAPKKNPKTSPHPFAKYKAILRQVHASGCVPSTGPMSHVDFSEQGSTWAVRRALFSLQAGACKDWLDGWKNAELPLCNHGLGFGNPSRRSLFLNRLDQNSDLSDFFLMEYTYIYMYILQIAIKWPKKKSEVHHSLTKLWSSGGSHAWELGQSHARLLAALWTAAGARSGRKWHEQ